MTRHLAFYALVARHRLDAAAARQLAAVLGLRGAPPSLAVWLPRVSAALSAGLIGFGVILAVAANWDSLGRFGQLALLQLLVAAACAGAFMLPRLRAPLAFLALLGIGGLLADLGQTYQTGADPWQLFALWAALGTPLCLGTRNDLLWSLWSLVAMTGIALWIHAETGQSWHPRAGALPTHALGWSLGALITVALGPLGHRLTGAGPWAARLSVTLLAVLISSAAILSLIGGITALVYWLGLAVSIAAALGLARARRLDVYALSVTALVLSTLVVAGLSNWLLEHRVSDPTVQLLFIGIVAAGLLAGAVTLILREVKRRSPEGRHD